MKVAAHVRICKADAYQTVTVVISCAKSMIVTLTIAHGLEAKR